MWIFIVQLIVCALFVMISEYFAAFFQVVQIKDPPEFKAEAESKIEEKKEPKVLTSPLEDEEKSSLKETISVPAENQIQCKSSLEEITESSADQKIDKENHSTPEQELRKEEIIENENIVKEDSFETRQEEESIEISSEQVLENIPSPVEKVEHEANLSKNEVESQNQDSFKEIEESKNSMDVESSPKPNLENYTDQNQGEQKFDFPAKEVEVELHNPNSSEEILESKSSVDFESSRPKSEVSTPEKPKDTPPRSHARNLAMKYLNRKSESEYFQVKAIESLQKSEIPLDLEIAQILAKKCAESKLEIAKCAVETCWKCLENGFVQEEDICLEILNGFLNAISNLKVSAVRISGAQYLVKAASTIPIMQTEIILLQLEEILNSPKCFSGAILLAWSEIALKLEKYEEFQRKIIALKDHKAHGIQVAIPQAIKLFKRR
jgi:hypothetical protein